LESCYLQCVFAGTQKKLEVNAQQTSSRCRHVQAALSKRSHAPWAIAGRLERPSTPGPRLPEERTCRGLGFVVADAVVVGAGGGYRSEFGDDTGVEVVETVEQPWLWWSVQDKKTPRGKETHADWPARTIPSGKRDYFAVS